MEALLIETVLASDQTHHAVDGLHNLLIFPEFLFDLFSHECLSFHGLFALGVEIFSLLF